MHDKHQAFFDQLAEEWDLMFTAEDLERLTHIVDKLNVTKGLKILDLGCGTGILFDMLRRQVGEEGSVTGVDFSFEMAQKAHRNFPFVNVNVVDADASALPFADDTFDMIVCFSSFPHFTDKQAALDEAHRVMKKDCTMHIIHLESSLEINKHHHEIGGVVEHDALPTGADLEKMFNDSNFTDVTIDDHPGLFLATATNRK